MDFSIRSTALELMDDPNMDAAKYREAYLDINRCNRLLGGYGITLNAIQNIVKKNPKKSYTILDMGCGDGEMLRKISKLAEKQEFEVKLIGIDLRDDVLDISRSKSKANPNIKYIKQDILTLHEDFDCDIVLCTLTMHHFTEKQIEVFIQKFISIAKLGVIINDLERSKLSFYLFKLFSIFFIRTKVAKYDGLVSISKGFKKKELWAHSKLFKSVVHNIKWQWAFRYVWIMETNRLT